MMKNFSLINLISLLILINTSNAPAQSINNFEYLNPLPGSKYVSVKSNIIIRPGGIINKAGISDGLVQVYGSKSGNHTGKLDLSKDSKTLIFTPSSFFNTDEEVTVTLKEGLTKTNGQPVAGLKFNFHTSRNVSSFTDEKPVNNFNANNKITKSIAKANSFPSDLPVVNIGVSNNPSPGYLFVAPSHYLMIIDNEGTPVFYRSVGDQIYDFTLQPNGMLTYFIYPIECDGLDSSFNMVRSFGTANGFAVDVHDLLVLPNGNYYILGKQLVNMDMSKVVSGGQSGAQIIDMALQEFDSTGSLIFQWDALNHYKITDADDDVDLTQNTIDFVHFNSFEIDADGNILISARNLDEITKIDPNTGNIIWRLGGRNNQFTFINDNLGFSRQHNIRRLSNGDISIFDNGVFHPQQFSSFVEYKLDELNKTASLINRYTHNKNIFTETEGNIQELPNGNRLIDWGNAWNPAITEIRQDYSTAFELSYDTNYDKYNSYRFKWETNLFKTDVDSLSFGVIAEGDSISRPVTIYNPQNNDLTINEFYCSDSSFSSNTSLPVIIHSKDSAKINIMFKPQKQGTFTAAFSIRYNSYYQNSPQMIARQVMLSGSTNDVNSVKAGVNQPGQFRLYQNYPNPFNPSTSIEYSIKKEGKVEIEIFNSIGQRVAEVFNGYQQAGHFKINWNAKNFASGIYFYRIKAGEFMQVKKMILLK